MKILLIGRDGQIGTELQRVLPKLGDVVATNRRVLDLLDAPAVRRTLREVHPGVIVNAAAYTAVDRAESEAAAAFRVNADGPAVLAEEAARSGALLVHYSTDYVFDGRKEAPYVEADPPNPVNEYGRSKVAGERAIIDSGCRHLILRTSWVYSLHGSNFLLTTLRLARERRELRIVSDQFGAPTSAKSIAAATAALIARMVQSGSTHDLCGLYHLTDNGETSWHGFAEAILDHPRVRDRLDSVRLLPIPSAEYPTAARRPMNCRLAGTKVEEAFGISRPHWRSALSGLLSGYAGTAAVEP